MESKFLSKVAFLGPFGTFSHQVAYNYFGDAVTYEPKPSISSVFAALSPEVPFVCIPLENSTHGPVIETLDLFRSARWSKDAFIRDEITFKIEHCLFVASPPPSGDDQDGDGDGEGEGEGADDGLPAILDSIVAVYSHEQALGQCARWLDWYLPRARRVKTDSTAGAGQKILDSVTEAQTSAGLGREAAICPEICLQTQPGLKLVKKGIQDREDNQTRFAIVAYDLSIPCPVQRPPTALILSRTLLRILPKPNDIANVLSLLSAAAPLGLKIRLIDRRPALEGGIWSNVYFVALQHDSASALRESLPDLVTGLRRHADVVNLGIW